jgi:hypothetical protein
MSERKVENLVELEIEDVKELIKESWKVAGYRGSWLLLGAPGIGKCLRGDTVVATLSGGVELKNLRVGDAIYGMKDGKLAVGFVTQRYITRQPVICVKTERTEIHGSPLHWFFTNRGWVRGKDLIIGKDVLFLSPLGLMEYERYKVTGNGARVSCGDNRWGRLDDVGIREKLEEQFLLDFSTVGYLQYFGVFDRVVRRERIDNEEKKRPPLSLEGLAQSSSLYGNDNWEKARGTTNCVVTLSSRQKKASGNTIGMDFREEGCCAFAEQAERIHRKADKIVLGTETFEFRQERVIEIYRESEDETLYDISTTLGNYIANGIVVHNTEGIQQLCKELAESERLEFVLYDDRKFDEIMKNREKYWVHHEFAAGLSEPSDFMGIPRDADGYTKYKPLAWAVCLASGKGSLFLDEVTNVHRPDTQSAMLKVVCEKIVGYTRLGDDTLVIAAGNREEHSKLATALSEPMRAGKVTIVDMKLPSLDSWIEYMNMAYGDWDRRVALFLKKFPEFFIEQRWSEGYGALRSPRGWTKVALQSHKLSKDEFVEVIACGLVGREAAIPFCAFLRTKIPDIQKLEENARAWDLLSDDVKYFVIMELTNLGVDALSKYPNILTYMSDNDREYLNLLVMLKTEEEKKKFVMAAGKKLPKLFQALLKSAITISNVKVGELA